MPFLSNGTVQQFSLQKLHLDEENPRFGGRSQKKRSESAILSDIVSQHGINDLLCSISTNGFFDSEPIIGAISKCHGKEITVVEGNRRLSACLIIAGDPRAKAHSSLTAKYSSSAFKADTKLPVKVYDWSKTDHRRQLLPYLGIRHIVGAQQWDSYAKAAWIATMLKESELSIEEIRVMIGDDQKFIDRIVEGYYVTEQAIATNSYDPTQSLRNGRGSFQEFPFSWIYTALGYRSIRAFVGLPSENSITVEPIDQGNLVKVGKLFGYLFGSSGKNAAISDSREIKDLAEALSSQVTVQYLDSGESAEMAIEKLRPSEKRLEDLLRKADTTLSTCVGLASGLKSLDRKVQNSLVEEVEQIMQRAESLFDLLNNIRAAPSMRRTKSPTRKPKS